MKTKNRNAYCDLTELSITVTITGL